MGWEFITERPKPKKFVGMAWPHSANMDGLLMVMMAESIGLEMSWMVKDAVNQPGLGAVVRNFGGVFIDRSRPNGVVGQMVEEFERREEFALVVPPEGTRSRRDYWKSGFYRIALEAKVPLVPGFLDYGRKQGGFGPPIELTGDVHKDMDAVREFYLGGGYTGAHPKDVGPILLREEDPQSDTPKR